MMKSEFLCLALLGTLIIGNCNAAALNNNELEVREFLQATSDKLFTYYKGLELLSFQLEELESWNLVGHLDKFMNITEGLVEIVREAKQFDSSKFNNDELNYIFEIINSSADDAILGRWWLEQLLKAINAVEDMGFRKNMEKFRDKKVKLAYIPDIQNIIAYTNNTRELKFYWKQFRVYNSALVIRNMFPITDLILKAANLTGIPALDYWMKGFNITDMERIMNETQPLYLQLHAFMRSQLNKKYGDEIIKPDGIIPDHLFRQVIAQTWTNASIIEEMFPFDKLPNFNEVLKENNYEATELFKSSDRFYKSLGFDSLPENFWGSNIKMKKEKDTGDCKAEIVDITENVYMFYCHKMDFRAFLQAHGYMGQVYYAREKTNLPAYYMGAHNLERAVGESAILSASTFGHLKTIGLLDNFEVTKDIEFNRLLRMGFHTLLNIPQHFVHSKVMADFFAGKVELGLLNVHYWKLMDQYVGVGPPMHRLDDVFDFPEKFYIELNENKEGRKFNTEIFSYQFYKKLCKISGKYPNAHLHECDFFGSKDAGDALKKMMKLGSSKRLDKVLGALLPENPMMSSDAILEYYSPIKSWLTEMNEEANVKLGWTHSDKKVKRVILDSGEEYDDE